MDERYYLSKLAVDSRCEEEMIRTIIQVNDQKTRRIFTWLS